MSTAATVAAVTAANTATMAANAARHRAAVEACQVKLATYNAERATELEMRQYASCVQLLHPAPDKPMPAIVEVAVKVAIVLAIIGAVSPWLIRSDSGDSFGMRVFLGFLSSILLPAMVGFFGLLVYGAWWVVFG